VISDTFVAPAVATARTSGTSPAANAAAPAEAAKHRAATAIDPSVDRGHT